ncbi:MAG: hypothetical protein IID59_06935, partial [Proteobacteria bacterium]|nr:hypothetical protein [Pseudomonadota bacterium]
NNSLSDDERGAVLEHAKNCVACRREMLQLENLRDSIKCLSGSEPVPAPDMRNINARIDRFIERQNLARRSLLWVGRFFDRPWRTAYAVQTVLLVVLATALLWPDTPNTPKAGFTMLTQSRELAVGHYVRAVFSPELTAAELQALLDDLQLAIVDGPTDRGVYTLAAGNSKAVEERDAALIKLSQSPGVLFAQPVNQGTGQ